MTRAARLAERRADADAAVASAVALAAVLDDAPDGHQAVDWCSPGQRIALRQALARLVPWVAAAAEELQERNALYRADTHPRAGAARDWVAPG